MTGGDGRTRGGGTDDGGTGGVRAEEGRTGGGAAPAGRAKDFLITKHGLAAALHSDEAGFDALHTWFLDRLLPVCTALLAAGVAAGETRADIDAYTRRFSTGSGPLPGPGR